MKFDASVEPKKNAFQDFVPACTAAAVVGVRPARRAEVPEVEHRGDREQREECGPRPRRVGLGSAPDAAQARRAWPARRRRTRGRLGGRCRRDVGPLGVEGGGHRVRRGQVASWRSSERGAGRRRGTCAACGRSRGRARRTARPRGRRRCRPARPAARGCAAAGDQVAVSAPAAATVTVDTTRPAIDSAQNGTDLTGHAALPGAPHVQRRLARYDGRMPQHTRDDVRRPAGTPAPTTSATRTTALSTVVPTETERQHRTRRDVVPCRRQSADRGSRRRALRSRRSRGHRRRRRPSATRPGDEQRDDLGGERRRRPRRPRRAPRW